jgi:hypothetical protein
MPTWLAMVWVDKEWVAVDCGGASDAAVWHVWWEIVEEARHRVFPNITSYLDEIVSWFRRGVYYWNDEWGSIETVNPDLMSDPLRAHSTRPLGGADWPA